MGYISDRSDTFSAAPRVDLELPACDSYADAGVIIFEEHDRAYLPERAVTCSFYQPALRNTCKMRWKLGVSGGRALSDTGEGPAKSAGTAQVLAQHHPDTKVYWAKWEAT